jgi:hypothetical protein
MPKKRIKIDELQKSQICGALLAWKSCDTQSTKNKANDNWFVKQVESIINNDQYEGKKNNSL